MLTKFALVSKLKQCPDEYAFNDILAYGLNTFYDTDDGHKLEIPCKICYGVFGK